MLKGIAKKIQPLWSSSENNLKNTLIKGVAGSFGLKIVASGLTFVMSVIFARFLGTVGLGTYSYATSWANLLSIPATLGIDQLVVRELAIYRSKARWELMGGILRWANLLVLCSSITMALVATAIIWYLKNGSDDKTIMLAIALSMIYVPLSSLTSLKLGAMKGLHRVVLGQVPDGLFGPIIIIILTTAVYFLFPDSFGVFWVLSIKIFSSIITFVIGTRWLIKSLPKEVNQIVPQYKAKQWLTDALPFIFLGTAQILNTRIDILMLGSMVGVKPVGIYTVILGITRLTGFIHQSTNSVLGPTIASLYSEGKVKQLERILHKSVMLEFGISLFIGIIIICFGKLILMIFGAEFTPGYIALSILIVGQVFNSLTGPVGLVLNMTGHQNHTAIAITISAVLNVILNAILIPHWGINGAATATTISLITINVTKVSFMQKTLGISLYSFGSKRK